MSDNEQPLILPESLSDISALERQAKDFEVKAAKLTQKAAAIRQIIAGVKTLNGDAEAVLLRRSFEAHKTAFETRPLDENGPRGPKAVLTVMRERPDHVWKVVDLKRELLRRGWAPTPKAVEASVKRLRELNEIEGVGYGFYKIPPETADQPDTTTQEADAA